MIRKLGASLNSAGELASKSGMRLCYHNHAFEYKPTEDGRLLDVLMKSTDPSLVSLELDVMWAQVAGVDPVSVLKQYGDRIPLLHLKNVAQGTKQRFNENDPAGRISRSQRRRRRYSRRAARRQTGRREALLRRAG